MADWDVFVSYTHADRAAATRIQAFVEDYPLPGGRRRLRVFRDQTDLRAGELGRNIPQEIGRARVLMLCCSPAAARSGWVAREVAAFHAAHGDDAPLVPLLLAGEPDAVVPEVLRGREALILDLRAGWRFGRPRGTTRVELLRAVAAAADVPLRELIPWDAMRRRKRWAITGAAVLVAVAAVAATGTSAWMTQREARAAALRRDAEAATLRIEAGDVAEGVAALGHALARDERRLLAEGLDVFRHWLAVLPSAETSARGAALLRMAGRVYAGGNATGALVPLDAAEPFTAVVPWPGRLVTAGPGGIAVLAAATGRREAEAVLPPGTTVVGLHLTRGADALVVLARMTRIENDEDEPNLPIPCTAVLLRGPPGATATVPVRIVTAETHDTRPMRRLPGGDLFWHDCVDVPPGADTAALAAGAVAASASAIPTPSAAASAAPATLAAVLLDVPRLPDGNDVLVPDRGTWDQAMREAWPPAAALTVLALPAPHPEAVLWGAAGATPSAPPQRFGLARTMDQQATDALGLDRIENGQSIFGEVVDLAGFDDGAGGRVFWGIHVCGNSFVCMTRCALPAATTGKPPSCIADAGVSALAAWQVVAPDARRFAHLSSHMAEPPLTVFDIAGYARRAPDRQPAAPVTAAAFSADGRRLAVLTAADQLLVYALGADATPKLAHEIGLGRGGTERRCGGSSTLAAVGGARLAVLTADCTLQLVDLDAGAPLWRTRLDAPDSAEGTPQLAVSPDGASLRVLAGGRLRLIQAATGKALSAPLDLASLPGVQRGATIRAGLAPHAAGGAPAIDIDGRLYVRAAPPQAEAARLALPTLDRHTLISTADGRTPLGRLPGR